MTDLRTGAPILAGPRRPALLAIAAVGVAATWGLAVLPFEGAAPRPVALGIYALIGAVILDRLPPNHPHTRFGFGNGLTLVRAGGTVGFVALALEPGLLVGPFAWAALAGAALLLALDGIDGLVARQEGRASAFGARFDMEVDALLILALSVVAVGLGKAGPWVVALGLIRYAFVLAGWLVPALARPLPPSRRRRLVCALQVSVLGLLLAPPVVPPLSTALAAAAFAALLWSFAADVAWLARRRR